MAEEKNLHETHRAEKESVNFWKFKFSRKTLLTFMLIIGIVLLIPLFYLVISIANSNNPEVIDDEKFSAPYVAGSLVVKLKDSYTADEIQRLNNKFKELGVIGQEKLYEGDNPNLANYYILKFKDGIDVKESANELSKLNEIESLTPNYIFEADVVPNDTLYAAGQLWGLDKIGMPAAWDIAQGDAGVIVAVLDTGVNYNHEDFAGKNIIKGGDFSTCNTYSRSTDGSSSCSEPKERDTDPMDDHGHGTHVAGTIAAATNNNQEVAGVDWNATLLAIKTMGRSSSGELGDIEKGIEDAIAKNTKVINMSLSAGIRCSQVPSMQAIIDEAISKGIVVVAAAGNGDASGIGISAALSTPASCNGVITVGATDQNDRRATFSNFGPVVDLSAPGVGIHSLNSSGGTVSRSGTSMAAPHVAGVVSLLLSKNPALSPAQVRDCLVNNSTPIQSPDIGPRLNAFNVLNVCSGLPPITPSPTIAPSITVSPTVTLAPNTPGAAQYIIEGIVFIDANGNRLLDSTETGYNGAQISLIGAQNSSILTDSSGRFKFSSLTPGSYTLSLTINNQTIQYPQTINLSTSQPGYSVDFILSSGFASQPGGAQPTPQVQINPLPTASSIPTPTPIQTFTCRENDNDYAPQGTIQLGTLICTPNN